MTVFSDGSCKLYDDHHQLPPPPPPPPPPTGPARAACSPLCPSVPCVSPLVWDDVIMHSGDNRAHPPPPLPPLTPTPPQSVCPHTHAPRLGVTHASDVTPAESAKHLLITSTYFSRFVFFFCCLFFVTPAELCMSSLFSFFFIYHCYNNSMYI